MSNISVAQTQTPSVLTEARSKMATDRMANITKNTTTLSEKDMEKINKTAQDFEAVFVTEMMKPIFNTVQVDPEFGGGKGEEVFRDFMLNEYGKKLAAQGGFGIAPHVRDQLIRLQEAGKGTAPPS